MRRDLFTVRKVIADVNTENDGHSWDAVRVAGSYLLIPAVPVFLWGTVYNTLHTGHFDFTGFAWGMSGIASVIVALATGINVKSRTDVMIPPSPIPPPLPPPPGEQQ
jgi:hypothetical protein